MESLPHASIFVSLAVAAAASIITLFVLINIVRKFRYQNIEDEKKTKKKKYPPFAGSMLDILFNYQRLCDYTTELATKYTTYRMWSPTYNEIFTSDPKNVEHILKSNFNNYVKGSRTYDNFSDLLGDGIFVVDGEKWRHQRNLWVQELSTKASRDFSFATFQEKAAILANVVAGAAKSNQIFDIQDLLTKSAMASISKVALGADLDTVMGSEEEGEKFSAALEDASALIMKRYFDFLWQIKKIFNIGSEAKLKKSIEVIDNFVYMLMEKEKRRRDELQDDPSLAIKKDDIVSRFLQSGTTDLRFLRDIILNFILGGKDSTATTLSWFIYMLCKHPEIEEKVARNIRNETDSLRTANYAEFASSLDEESLEKMQYLHATLTETIRLYPAAPMNVKRSCSDDILPDGYSVNKGDFVYYLSYGMGRMKFIWGADAEEFRPERWLDADGNFQPESPYKFVGFQAGPRICVGRDFAYKQMKMNIAVLLNFFTFKLADEGKQVKYKTMLTLRIDDGLNVRAAYR